MLNLRGLMLSYFALNALRLLASRFSSALTSMG